MNESIAKGDLELHFPNSTNTIAVLIQFCREHFPGVLRNEERWHAFRKVILDGGSYEFLTFFWIELEKGPEDARKFLIKSYPDITDGEPRSLDLRKRVHVAVDWFCRRFRVGIRNSSRSSSAR